MIDIGKLKTLPENTDIGKIRLSDGRWLVVSTISRIADDTAAGKETDNLQPGTLAFKGGGMRNDFR